ncbi:UrcA family protein [Sphingomonas sp. MAH-20]|jgi:UrcA family protein|uniref:UrcA family protein n=1 Tax=Sphingomonas horti TaxID=2682842 RepID=A0A6I4J4W6_9SPHN|nr:MULTISPECIES: UrcA family protein [Sphingomonas]MBA2919121.1 UrcA family protein [Sphingomonas sp. CGMCC 1.13658]MVO79153.1 UrcA family protein [Sphingomonas horti]
MKTLILLPLALLGLASPSIAQPADGRVAVSTAGLDLATPAGVRALDLRILHAASAVCGTPSSADPQGRARADRCRDDARAAAASERDRLVRIAANDRAVVVASKQ